MEKPAARTLKIFAALLLVALVVGFVIQAQKYLSDRGRKEKAPKQISANDAFELNAPINAEMLQDLDWKNFQELTQKIGTDAGKIRQVIRLTSGLQNSAQTYIS